MAETLCGSWMLASTRVRSFWRWRSTSSRRALRLGVGSLGMLMTSLLMCTSATGLRAAKKIRLLLYRRRRRAPHAANDMAAAMQMLVKGVSEKTFSGKRIAKGVDLA